MLSTLACGAKQSSCARNVLKQQRANLWLGPLQNGVRGARLGLDNSVDSRGRLTTQQSATLCQERTTCNLSFADMDFSRQLLSRKKAFVVDCDGVLYHDSTLLPGARAFVDFLQKTDKKYLFLTNSSDKSASRLVEKFAKLGLRTSEENFYTSAMSTATFLKRQKRGGRAFVIGEECLKNELRREGILVIDKEAAEMSTPDFLVVGESASNELYNFSTVEFAVKIVRRGARLIGTNEDIYDRIGDEKQPGTGALILPISTVSGVKPYFVGKPNPLMVRSALDRLNVSRDDAVVVGDRMNTDIRAGVEASVDTVLVLSGVTTPEDVITFSYRPSCILTGVGDIAAIIAEHSATTKILQAAEEDSVVDYDVDENENEKL
mmetsp:Transcript_19952/g.39175  ORF Transcript_19952/g.39175 Transcript_19952/m.39175 type:complete len:377 (+) Transcript_19952:209-1339(+)